MKELTMAMAKEIMEQNGGSLDLRFTDIDSLPDNLTVGGSLDLSHTKIESLPENLVVGGWLNINNTNVKSLPENLKIGDLVCADKTLQYMSILKPGDYEPGRYLYADGILTHIKDVKKIQGYTLYVGKIKGKNVVSDGIHYAHCSDFREGIKDLLFKTAADRGAEPYKHLTLDSEVPTEDAITMYRVITGACRQGTQAFVDTLGELKASYTVREIIDLTDGRYGSESFKKFFHV